MFIMPLGNYQGLKLSPRQLRFVGRHNQADELQMQWDIIEAFNRQAMDCALFRTGFVYQHWDGRVEHIKPEDVIIELPAQQGSNDLNPGKHHT